MTPPSWAWRWYPSSRPRKKEGGIKAKSRRGQIGRSWWSRRLIDLLAEFGMQRRLARGRAYARSGQVFDLVVTPGRVSAKVQGSRYEPYEVAIEIKPFGRVAWRRVARELCRRAAFVARLIAGEMPIEIEQAFAACNLSLFPKHASALRARCTCPDGGNPCKHIAATYYILAEQFDDDPFLVLRWRGCERAELLAAMRSIRARTHRLAARRRGGESEPASAALDPRPARFWGVCEEPAPIDARLEVPPDPAQLISALGATHIDAGGVDLLERLYPLYHFVPHQARSLALGREADERTQARPQRGRSAKPVWQTPTR